MIAYGPLVNFDARTGGADAARPQNFAPQSASNGPAAEVTGKIKFPRLGFD